MTIIALENGNTAAEKQSHPITGAIGGAELLGQSLKEEHHYQAEIEGELPAQLQGTLYRNGPGLFERDGYRKKHLLDGDGMIQRIHLKDGKATYQNHFVRTKKFVNEEKAGRYLYPTWTTLAPRWYQNLPGVPTRSQAGVVATVRNGVLYALDEVGRPWALDPDLLTEIGPYTLTEQGAADSYKAHNKVDGKNGDWIFVGWTERRSSIAQVLIKNKQGETVVQQNIHLPRRGYIHDFFITENYVIINLTPIGFDVVPTLLGRKSITDTMRWRPEKGNLLCIVERKNKGKVKFIPAPATYMWHVFNAYENDDGITADFIGFDDPNHFVGENAALKVIMDGQPGEIGALGTIRRYHIDLVAESAEEETLFEGNYEFPMVHYAKTGYAHRYGFCCGRDDEHHFYNYLSKVDFETGSQLNVSFGKGVLVSEPVYAVASEADDGRGHLLSMCWDTHEKKSFLAVVDAEKMELVCKIKLRHSTPVSFHGCWAPTK